METRSFRSKFEQSGNTLIGYGIVWNRPTQIHERNRSFTEVVKRGSVNYPQDVICTFNHSDRLLGRVSSGTMKLVEDDYGVRFEVQLPESAADIRELVHRGDLQGASFTFAVRSGGERWDGSTRELTALDVYEMGPVVAPAYTDAVLVGLRSRMSTLKAKLKLLERM